MQNIRERRIGAAGDSVWSYRADAALYCLVLRHRGSHDHAVGALGSMSIDGDWVYYVGRDRRGWRTRCRRYVSGVGTPHWHIDYLIACSDSTLLGICPVSWHPKRECELLERVRACSGVKSLTEGFGASDCGSGCPAHAVAGARRPDRLFRSLAERVRNVSGWIHFDKDRSRWRSL